LTRRSGVARGPLLARRTRWTLVARGARCPLCTGIALGARWSNGSARSLLTLNAGLARNAYWTICACGSVRSLRSLRSLAACGAACSLRPGRAHGASRTLSASRSLCALKSLWAGGSCWALRARDSLNTLLALDARWSCWALCALWSLEPCYAHRAGRARRACCARWASWSYRAGGSCGALGASWARHSGRARHALGTLLALGSDGSWLRGCRESSQLGLLGIQSLLRNEHLSLEDDVVHRSCRRVYVRIGHALLYVMYKLCIEDSLEDDDGGSLDKYTRARCKSGSHDNVIIEIVNACRCVSANHVGVRIKFQLITRVYGLLTKAIYSIVKLNKRNQIQVRCCGGWKDCSLCQILCRSVDCKGRTECLSYIVHKYLSINEWKSCGRLTHARPRLGNNPV
jgi:hypothetical protein